MCYERYLNDRMKVKRCDAIIHQPKNFTFVFSHAFFLETWTSFRAPLWRNSYYLRSRWLRSANQFFNILSVSLVSFILRIHSKLASSPVPWRPSFHIWKTWRIFQIKLRLRCTPTAKQQASNSGSSGSRFWFMPKISIFARSFESVFKEMCKNLT